LIAFSVAPFVAQAQPVTELHAVRRLLVARGLAAEPPPGRSGD
jgi:hypothetical protein